MPPKKNETGKKNEKQKQKIIEDKTFGMKNKKGKKQQQFVKNVELQIRGNKSHRQQEIENNKKKEKVAEIDKIKEINSLFKPVVEKQKIEPGVDPKSVLCVYFKQSACTKGDKCKFSHDLSIERRQEKRDLFIDSRDKFVVNDEEVRDFNREELEELIIKKHGSHDENRTDIVCKYFIEAVEKRLYGWFWVCPNGGDNCPYRHALPPGYVLKTDKPVQKQVEEISIEELVEAERYNLEGDLTPVNEESFKEWKEKKILEKKKAKEELLAKKKQELISGKITSVISGRDAFALDPELIKVDDEEANDEKLCKSEEVCEEEVTNLDKNLIASKPKVVSDEKATRVLSLNPKDRHVSTPKMYDKELEEVEELATEIEGTTI